MADFSSFYQKSIYFTLVMFIFILAFNFVIGLGIFGNVAAGPTLSGTPEENVIKLFNIQISFTDFWKTSIGIAVVGAVFLAIATQSMTAVATFLYGTVFWSGFISLWGVFGTFALQNATLLAFFGIGFAVMIIIFIAGVIGMLGGAG